MAIESLIIYDRHVYTGSADCSIRVWPLDVRGRQGGTSNAPALSLEQPKVAWGEGNQRHGQLPPLTGNRPAMARNATAPFEGSRPSTSMGGHGGRARLNPMNPPEVGQLPPRPATVMEQRQHPVLSQCLKTYAGHTKAVYSLCASPEGGHIISACGDYTINVWDRLSGEVVNTLSGHAARVRGITPHVSDGQGCKAGKGGGNQVISVSDDCSMRIWAKAIPNLPKIGAGDGDSDAEEEE